MSPIAFGDLETTQRILQTGGDTKKRGNEALLVMALTCTYPGRIDLASPLELTTSRMEVPQGLPYCANSLEILALSFLHRVQPTTRGPE